MSAKVAGAAVALAVIAGASYALIGPQVRGPIMACDPTALKKGMPEREVIGLCGEPRKKRDTSQPWYPLSGGTRETAEQNRESQWVYGSVLDDDRHVNLYMRGGELRGVQIYGDYK